jgi:hypothetical protein
MLLKGKEKDVTRELGILSYDLCSTHTLVRVGGGASGAGGEAEWPRNGSTSKAVTSDK